MLASRKENNMSLITELLTLTKARRFALLVSSDHETGLLTIGVMPRASNERDGVYCKDLTLAAKPEEFDADFTQAIGAYRSKMLPLLELAKRRRPPWRTASLAHGQSCVTGITFTFSARLQALRNERSGRYHCWRSCLY